jgi:hypothetical protein
MPLKRDLRSGALTNLLQFPVSEWFSAPRVNTRNEVSLWKKKNSDEGPRASYEKERADAYEGHFCSCLWNSGRIPLGDVSGVGVGLEPYLFSPRLVPTDAA